jgi:hypothetical protein
MVNESLVGDIDRLNLKKKILNFKKKNNFLFSLKVFYLLIISKNFRRIILIAQIYSFMYITRVNK